MKIKIGFCEIALIMSFFFYPLSKPIGIILLIIAVAGVIASYAIDWSEKAERAKMLKEANENLAESLATLSAAPAKNYKQTKNKDPKAFLYANYLKSDEEN